MKRWFDKKNNEALYLLDKYDKGMVTQIPRKELSSEALLVASNMYYNDGYQLRTLGGWNATVDFFGLDISSKYILFAFDDVPICVERTGANTCTIHYKDASGWQTYIPATNRGGDTENWGGYVWKGDEDAYEVYVYFRDGTSNWRVHRILYASGGSDQTTTLIAGSAGFLDTTDGMFVFASRVFSWSGLMLFWTAANKPLGSDRGVYPTDAGFASILGQKGTKITSVQEFYDNLVVFLDESTIRFIGRDPNPLGTDSWYLSVVSPSVGCKWRRGSIRIGADIFFINEQGLSYLTAIQMYGSIAVDVLSLNISDFMEERLLDEEASGISHNVSLVYSHKHKSLFISRHTAAGSNLFLVLKMLRKKEGGQWTYGYVDTTSNYAGHAATNWYTPMFGVNGVPCFSSAQKSGTSYTNVGSGILDKDITADSRVAWVLNISDVESFRVIQLRLLTQFISDAYWRLAVWRNAQWQGTGLVADIEWVAQGDAGYNSGEATVSESAMYRYTVGLESRHLTFDLLLKDVSGDWIMGALNVITKVIRNLASIEV